MRTPHRFTVALLIETSNRYSRELLDGIRNFMRKAGNWAVHLTEHGRGNVPPPWLAKWRGDGIIARIENREIARAVRGKKVPVINVSASGIATEFPTVISDSAGVGHLAADHLLERGFQHFGFCGDARFAWSARHAEHFAVRVLRAGHTCDFFQSAPDDFADWQREQQKLARWIQSLPKPAGIMACYDIRGQQVLDVCRALGVEVPGEVAVIGQHNDELLCELCDPPLSSVIPNPQRAGFEAAEMLHRIMSGGRVAARVYGIEPIGVATRQSTDLVALADPQIAQAIRFINQNACHGIGVRDVLRAVPMSRTLFERRFRRLLGRSPYDAILQVRLRQAKELLTATNLAIAEIADRTGFSSPEYLSAAFKKQVRMCPREYRSHHSVPSPLPHAASRPPSP